MQPFSAESETTAAAAHDVVQLCFITLTGFISMLLVFNDLFVLYITTFEYGLFSGDYLSAHCHALLLYSDFTHQTHVV